MMLKNVRIIWRWWNVGDVLSRWTHCKILRRWSSLCVLSRMCYHESHHPMRWRLGVDLSHSGASLRDCLQCVSHYIGSPSRLHQWCTRMWESSGDDETSETCFLAEHIARSFGDGRRCVFYLEWAITNRIIRCDGGWALTYHTAAHRFAIACNVFRIISARRAVCINDAQECKNHLEMMKRRRCAFLLNTLQDPSEMVAAVCEGSFPCTIFVALQRR